MLENFIGMLRKRRRVDTNSDAHPLQQEAQNNARFPSANTFWDTLFRANSSSNSHTPSGTAPATTASSASDASSTPNCNHFSVSHENNASQSQFCDTQIARPFNLNERFVNVLDELDARVEKFRKEAMGLQDKKDFLLMSIDLIKSHDLLNGMMEYEREEIHCYIQRVNSRLSTVDLNVRTVRDQSQEDSLYQINALIDMMITMGDPVLARQRCQQYLNACCSAAETRGGHHAGLDMDAGPVDKKFEGTLLGCTLDDQKNIKKRLQALMGYLNKQTIRN